MANIETNFEQFVLVFAIESTLYWSNLPKMLDNEIMTIDVAKLKSLRYKLP